MKLDSFNSDHIDISRVVTFVEGGKVVREGPQAVTRK
jgi:hypothetical protein